jgi:hypothetical protein
MRKPIFAIFFSIISCLCTLAQDQEVKQYTLNVGDFAELNVVDGLNVEYVCSTDSAGYVTFSSTADKAPMVLFSNDKNTLKIQLQSDGSLVKSLPTITVRSAYLLKAENSGDSTIVINSPAAGANIKLRVIGNGSIIAKGLHATCVEGKIDTGRGHLVLQGITQWAKLRTVGAGSIEAGDLKADKGSLLISGTGSVDCYVTGELNVKGLGSGKVYLKGTPTIKNRTLGTVKIINVE